MSIIESIGQAFSRYEHAAFVAKHAWSKLAQNTAELRAADEEIKALHKQLHQIEEVRIPALQEARTQLRRLAFDKARDRNEVASEVRRLLHEATLTLAAAGEPDARDYEDWHLILVSIEQPEQTAEEQRLDAIRDRQDEREQQRF